MKCVHWLFFTDGARSRYQYVKTVIRSGQILKLLAVYEDIAEQSTRSKRLSWPLLGSKHQSTQYAQCMTVKKQVSCSDQRYYFHFRMYW